MGGSAGEHGWRHGHVCSDGSMGGRSQRRTRAQGGSRQARTGAWAGKLEEATTSVDSGAGELKEAARAKSYGAAGNKDDSAGNLG